MKSNNFLILLDRGWMQFHNINKNLKTILNPKRETVMQCHTQAGNITTNMKVKYILSYPKLVREIVLNEIFMGMTELRTDIT